MAKVVVYLDLVFLINLLADGAILLATAWTRKLRIRWWRIALSAVFGAAYALLMMFPDFSILFAFAAKLLFSAAMVWIAFGFVRLPDFIRNLAAFYMVNFVLAGGIFGLHYFFLPASGSLGSILFTRSGLPLVRLDLTLWFVAAAFAFMLWYYVNVWLSTRKRETLVQYLVPVEVQVDDVRLACTGLIDTGNHLYDPLTKTPVIIMETELWKDVLPEAWLKRIRETEADKIVAAMGMDDFKWQDRLRIVPYRGVNRSTQLMLALKPDLVTVIVQERRIETGKVLIGFDGGTLSADGSYQAIIHPMLLET